MQKFTIASLFLIAGLVSTLNSLPVTLGKIYIGLESSDGYQEGLAQLSTDDTAENLEILIAYRGFGLDEISWLFANNGLAVIRDSVSKAEWWRTQLLEMEINQTVHKNVTNASPIMTYKHRNGSYPFEDTECIVQFVRQGKDYALIIADQINDDNNRMIGNMSLPVFTLHFSSNVLSELNNLLSESKVNKTVTAYNEQRLAIEKILSSSPESSGIDTK